MQSNIRTNAGPEAHAPAPAMKVIALGQSLASGKPLKLPEMVEVNGKKFISVDGLRAIANSTEMVFSIYEDYQSFGAAVDVGGCIVKSSEAFVDFATGKRPTTKIDMAKPMHMELLDALTNLPDGSVPEVNLLLPHKPQAG